MPPELNYLNGPQADIIPMSIDFARLLKRLCQASFFANAAQYYHP